MSDLDARLARLAELHGVATSWQDQLDRTVAVDAGTVVGVLAALGVDATDDVALDAALETAEAADRDPGPPPVVLVRPGAATDVPVGPADASSVRLLREDGSTDQLTVEGGAVRLPTGLPLGWHRLQLSGGDVPVLVAPEQLPAGPRGWGWMVQLYALRSSRSWGIGDLADLRTLVDWTAAHGGALVLVNPLHAVAPVEPMQPSPYYPASRRWLNPVYLHVEDLPEYAAAEPEIRRQVDALRPSPEGDRIDRDAAWAAKQSALRLLFDPADVEEPDADLADYATWAAIVEQHGADWRSWPQELQRPGAAGVDVVRVELADRIRWHAWLQRRTDEQCRAVQEAARAAGMPVGVMHDLAVGTDAGGADAWALQDALALDARIGAPPDEFNQQGQDWGMPPWHPGELAHLGYAPLRDMVRAQLRRGGGLRIDHVLGLFRLWWIPDGASPTDGTYVRYDADTLLAVIALEAARAGAVVVGEDLGVVPKAVRRTLAEVGVLGTSLLLFEREDAADGAAGALVPLERWREPAVASVTTHDLPTVLGWLRGEHVRVRGELGLLRDVDVEWRNWRRERDELVAGLQAAGVAGPDPSEADLARAMHRALPLTPSRYVLAAPGDAVGDLRQPNVPGTTDEYPNWRLAVTDADGRTVLLDDLLADPRTARLADDLADEASRTGR
jgi:4-alpha-glucanotransferase